jgi:octanoyl-[GcvH]:protein N-octanoyltransferase
VAEHNLAWTKGLILLDRTSDEINQDISYPFALDELIGRQVGEGGPPVCHLWRHPRAFIIGSRDNRLPSSGQALRWLQSKGYSTLTRHSGGAAVPLDMGVVNLSLILPIQDIQGQELHRDFERMYALLHRTIASIGCEVDKGEVIGSYCPGDYDLHIRGRKFCGIAQRRQMRAVIIQAFINAEGTGDSRAALVRDFYERASVGAEPGIYPKVEEGRMTSLQESGVINTNGASVFIEAIKRIIGEHHSQEISAERFRMPEHSALMSKCEELRGRYLTTPKGGD